MGQVAYFSMCLLGCLIFIPLLQASLHSALSPHPLRSLRSRTGARSCITGWKYYNRHCYGIFPSRKTWSEAELACQFVRNGFRYHLASILSKAEADAVAKFIIQSGYKANVWIGLHNPHPDRHWEWTDGSTFSYSDWKIGEPNNQHNRENCAELLSYKGFKKWNDAPCNKKNAYICKHEL